LSSAQLKGSFVKKIMAVHTLTDQTFQQILAEQSMVVVKYYADWCGSCKLFAPKFRRLSEDERFTGVFFAEVNAEDEPEARQAAGVDNLPFIATFKNGKLLSATATSKEEKAVDMLTELTA
jgi:thioredoxin 1